MPWLRQRQLNGNLPDNNGVTAISPTPGEVHAFGVRQADGTAVSRPRTEALLHWTWMQEPPPRPFSRLDPEDVSALAGGRIRPLTPAAVSWGPGRLDVIAIGAGEFDGQLVQYWREGDGAWGFHVHQGERGLLANCSPAAVSWAPGRLDFFAVRNPDGIFGPRTLMHWWWDGGAWRGPQSLGGRLRDVAPCVVSWAPTHLDVFAVGADENDGRVIHWRQDGDTWSAPTPLPGPTGLLGNGGLAAATWGPGWVTVCGVSAPEYAFGPRYLRQWWFDDGGWHGPERDTFAGERGWLEESRPAIVTPSAGRIDILATGNPEIVFGPRPLKRWNWDGSQWNGPEWVADGRPLAAGGPAVIARDSERYDVIANLDVGPVVLLPWDARYRSPEAPSNLRATILRTGDDGAAVRLDWRDESATETGFWLEVATGGPLGSDEGFTVAAQIPANITTAEHYARRPPSGEVQYRYRVRAVDGELLPSPPSGQEGVILPAVVSVPGSGSTPPPAPLTPQFELRFSVGGGGVQLFFGDIFPEDSGYELVSSTGERHIFTLGEPGKPRQFSQVIRRDPSGTEYWTVSGWIKMNTRRPLSSSTADREWAPSRIASTTPLRITWPPHGRIFAAATVVAVIPKGQSYETALWRWL